MSTHHNQYSATARALHWLVAGLIISQYILSELAEYAEHNNNVVGQLALLANHKSIGMTVLALAVLRILWRLCHKPAPLPDAMPKWQHTVSSVTHWALYVLIFALPISGWLMSSSFGYSVSWFNLFTFPDLLAIDKGIAADLNQVHEWLGNSLLALAALHISAALKHHFIDRDDVLRRMATTLGWCLLFATVLLSLVLFGRIPASTSMALDDRAPASTDSELGEGVRPSKASSLPVWQIDYSDSFIKFSGDQAGAPFSGEWQRWSATMQFSRDRLEASQFVVEIDAASAFSNDQERDDYIAGREFFDAENHAQVVFNAQQFTATNRGEFVAGAQLSIKGLTKPVVFTFTVEQTNDQVVLIGSATLDRLSWNIGTGDWVDSTWVGHDVAVSVRVAAKP